MTSNSCNYSVASPEMTSSNDFLSDVSDYGGVPADNWTSSPVPSECSGCRRAIVDRYFLQAVGQAWHMGGCLRCMSCDDPLDLERSCFVRSGLIYCRADYNRLFGCGVRPMSVDVESSRRTTSARCVACKQTFSAGDLVMRADVSLFHPTCFSCCICRRRLNRGQQFALVDAGRILCRADYERLHAQTQPAVATAATTAAVRDERCIDASGDSDELRPGHGDVDVCANPATKGGEDVSVQSTCAARSLCRNRWRTRKLIHCVQEDSVGGVCSGCAETLQYSADHFGGDGSNSSSTPRQKRLRTSFKHHQLRVLKTYFVLNHNPDAKDLKQLSQKTGLGKRILQVWFQNARAKYRRSLQRDEKTSDDQWTSSSASNVVAARTAVSSLSETETQRSCCTIAMVTSSVSSSSIYSDLQQNTGSCSD